MLSTFPSPVLSVAVEAVKDLEGGDALSGLWTLFTKCKESLKDGRRLENISWRLWYRELSSHSYRPPTPDSDSSGRTCHFSISSSAAAIAVNRREHYSPFGQSSKSVPSVGRFICDILPATQFKTDTTDTSREFLLLPSTDKAALDRAPLLPTPAVERSSIADSHLSVTFPHVVISHPTPHPTPPATPVIGDPSSQSPTNPPVTLSASPLPLSNLDSISANKTELTPVDPIQPDHPGCRSHEPQETAGVSLTRADTDENTLKPADRRFFLQSPDAESPERGDASSGSKNTTSEMGSSVNSTHTKSELDPVKNHVSNNKRGRGKESGRHTHHARQRPHFVHRRSHHGPTAGADRTKPAFHVGSASSAGSRPPTARQKGPSKGTETAEPPRQSASATRTADCDADTAGSKQPRKMIIMANSSSEYETETDSEDDDDSWVSEEVTQPVAAKTSNRPLDARRTKSQPSVAAAEARRLREAELEAQRVRDMFAKVPQRTYSGIVERNRTRSGLLSQLLNPDPSQFPPNHPYRFQRTQSQGGHTSFSSHDLHGLQYIQPQQSAKSAVAQPLAAQVSTTGEVRTLPDSSQNATAAGGNSRKTAGAYRPKGRPQGIDDYSDSDTDNTGNSIQVSQSIAQQRLAVLAGRRVQSSRGQPTRRSLQDSHQSPPPQPAQPVSPIPLTHPYNLPPPALPSTPRTTRRVMLQKELSESLRRNLLWERQVSKTNLAAMGAGRKSQSRETSRPTSPKAGPSRRHSEDMSDCRRQEDPPAPATKLRRHASGGVLGDGLRPLTALSSVVQLEPRTGLYGPKQEDNEREAKREQRKLNLARNRSFANDFHITGW